MTTEPSYTQYYLPHELVDAYLSRLIGQFFKILPLFEDGEPSIKEHMLSLQTEMIGCRELICSLKCDACYLSLISILQFFIDNTDVLREDLPTVKREVFKAISICNTLRERYGAESNDAEVVVEVIDNVTQ